MKRTITSLAFSLIAISSQAQVGAVAPNFTQTDINGVSHDLYTYLNAGKVVIVDMSATWCSPCWSFHQQHYLQGLHDQFGPSGTNEAVVIFYEDDVATTLAELNGSGTSTMGNWTTGVTYPMINATLTLPSQYGLGYPTVSVICPSDKKIKDLLGNYSTLDAMKTAVQTVINQCSISSIKETVDKKNALDVSISPNPTSDISLIKFNVTTAKNATIKLYSVSGQLISETSYSVLGGVNEIELNLATLQRGTYFVNISTNESNNKTIQVVKK
jgi:thiol-disulfide isomerase/thioredoxin